MTLQSNDRAVMITLHMKKAKESLDDSKSKSISPSTRVNRAYYSAFNCASALLLTRNIERSSHKGIISAFGEEFTKNGEIPQEFSKIIRKLEKRRYSADYSLQEEITEEIANDSCQEADYFYSYVVSELENILVSGGSK